MRFQFAVLIAVTLVLAGFPAHAQWYIAKGVVICDDADNQVESATAKDGSGGIIAAWTDYRAPNNGAGDIYAQRLDNWGFPQWRKNGIPVCAESHNQYTTIIVSDGVGGAIVLWQDNRNGIEDLYAQRISADGTALWTSDGVPICVAEGRQLFARMVADGAEGAFVAFSDNRRKGDFGSKYDIYVQHIGSNGSVGWTTDGVVICAPDTPYLTQPGGIVPDGRGGVIVVWDDRRADWSTYAQRVDASGNALWPINGTVIGAGLGSRAVSDGAGGVIVAWSPGTTRMQRVTGAGTTLWPSGGIVAAPSSATSLVADGVGGAVIAWADTRHGGAANIYAQRIDSLGVTQWEVDGAPVCTATGTQNSPMLCADERGGAFIGWTDDRNGLNQVFGQWLDSTGAPQWAVGGEQMFMMVQEHFLKGVVAGASSAIVTVETRSQVTFWDIRAQKRNLVTTDASGVPPRTPILSRCYPNPFSLSTAFEIQVEANVVASFEVYDITGRRIIAWTQELRVGANQVDYTGRDSFGRALPSGVYLLCARIGQDTHVGKFVIAR